MRDVSGILFPLRGDCHFSRPAVTRRLKRPTQKTRTSSPFGPGGPASSYLVLQPIRFTPSGCRHPTRELLPHVFTLTSREAVIFCGTCCYPFGHLPVRKYGALRCPDFPRAGFPDPRQSLSSPPQKYVFFRRQKAVVRRKNCIFAANNPNQHEKNRHFPLFRPLLRHGFRAKRRTPSRDCGDGETV